MGVDDPRTAAAEADRSSPPSPRFSVVVPTLGRSDALVRSVASILNLDPPPHEIVIADGGAEDKALKFEPGVRYLRCSRGLTKQRNEALAAVTGDVVVFLDDDVEVPGDLLRHLAAPYADPTVVGATGRVVEPSGGRLVGKESPIRRLLFGGGREGGFTSFGYPRRAIDVDSPQDIFYMQGCFMSARTSEARAVAFDENLTGYGLAEDEDFSYRLAQRGRIRYVPEAVVDHANLGFLSRDQRAFGRDVVLTRAYLFKKNFPQTWSSRMRFALFLVVLMAHRAVNREWNGLRGLWDGVIALVKDR